jgi:hypothetical protein
MARYEPDPRYDPDLVAALEAGGEQGLADAMAATCRTCGHTRADHAGATGALASFGGSACERCWDCGAFLHSSYPAEPPFPFGAKHEKDWPKVEATR